MKIVQLDIQGFRSLKNVSWRPGDLNVIIGPNGSGKSNLLRMLEMISAAAQQKLSRYIQSSGGFQAVVWDGQVSHIEWHITASVQDLILDMRPDPIDEPLLLYKIKLSRAYASSSSYYVEHENSADVNSDAPYFTRNRRTTQVLTRDAVGQVQTRTFKEDQVPEEESVLSEVAGPWNDEPKINWMHEELEAWAIYQDIRTDRDASIRQAPVSRLEQRVAPDGQNLINVLHTLYTRDRQFKQDINDAMSAAFGEDFDELIFPPDAGDQRIQMRVRWKTLKRDQSTADLSDGTLRFLFLMTVLASPNPPPLIAIDEPETGLHPSMMPIIAEFAAEAATRTQIIFTTHSDRFLDAFRDVRPTTTVARWENGETTLTTLDDAELAYWVEGYTLGSLFRSGELENMAS